MQTKKQAEKDNTIETAPLISVIVTIYNVEHHLRKCLDSLKGQSLKQIEVICIDDGSTDGSGRIADDYESQDWPIFRVIHTENRGVSAARNRGIDEAKAQWLMFVDSDDWVSADFCSIPYEAALENQADLVTFRSYRVFRFGRMKKLKKKNAPTGIVDEMKVYEYESVIIWNKLYNKLLFEGIRYPLGRVYEDLSTTHKIIHKSRITVMLEDYLYYHNIRRRNSITHSKKSKRKRDASIAEWERFSSLKKYGYPEEKLKILGCSAAIAILANTDQGCEYYSEATEVMKSIDSIPKSLNIRKKVAIAAWRLNPQLFYMMCRVAGRKQK